MATASAGSARRRARVCGACAAVAINWARKSARGRFRPALQSGEGLPRAIGTRAVLTLAFPVPKWHVAALRRDATAKFGNFGAKRVPRA
jgi:hypothetical protein